MSKRVIVVEIDPENAGKQLFQMINPVHYQQEGSMVWAEGCLGVVGYTAKVERSTRVLANAWTVDEKEIEAERLLAVAPRHEVGHLDDKFFMLRNDGQLKTKRTGMVI